jgi:hypothetical protein
MHSKPGLVRGVDTRPLGLRLDKGGAEIKRMESVPEEVPEVLEDVPEEVPEPRSWRMCRRRCPRPVP